MHTLDQININPGCNIDDLNHDNKVAVAGKLKRDAQRLELGEDFGFYTTIVFQSRHQVEAFCKAMDLVNDDGSVYHLDGLYLAKKFKVEIPKVDQHALAEALGSRREFTMDKKGVELFDESLVDAE